MTQHWPDRSDANRDKESDTELQSQSGHFKYQRGASPSGEAAMTGTMLHLIKWLPLRLIWTIRLSCDTSYSYQSGLANTLTLSHPTHESSHIPPLVSSHCCNQISAPCSLTRKAGTVSLVYWWFYLIIIDFWEILNNKVINKSLYFGVKLLYFCIK